jgi:putative transposase
MPPVVGHGSPTRQYDKMVSNRFRPIFPGATYFITSVSYKRKRWFANPVFAKIIVDQLKFYEKAYDFHLPAYAVMPDHYHAVITVGEKKTISQILHAVHSFTATIINQKFENTNKIRIWQGKAWDVVARDEAAYWRTIAYTLLNPWREGLVDDPLQPYPFSNITEWREREDDEFLLDLFAQIWDWGEFGE